MNIYENHDLSRPLNFDEFPPEIMILILSNVDPLTLIKLPLVCKQWNKILKNDMIWHEIFRIQYPFKSVFPTITRSHLYKTELLHRTHMKHEYKRGKMLNNTFCINNLAGSHTLTVDWSRNKLIAIDVANDRITSCDIRNGKMSNEFFKYIPADHRVYDAGYFATNVYGTRAIVYGSENGTVSGSIVDWKGLLVSDARKWGNMDGASVSAVCACINTNTSNTKDFEKSVPLIASLTSAKSKKKVLVMNNNSGIKLGNRGINSLHSSLTKTGLIGAFSADESGNLWGWDIRTGETLCRLHIPTFSLQEEGYRCIIKLLSDGKNVVVCIASNGEIWVIKNAFDMIKGENVEVKYLKIGQFQPRDPYNFLKNVFVDYGNETVTMWNDYELNVFSYNQGGEEENEYVPNILVYTPPEGTYISLVSFESNAKPFLKRDETIVGYDPLYSAVVLTDGSVSIINIRESVSNFLQPIHHTPIKPKFLKEFYKANRYEISETLGPIAAVALTSMIVAVSNHEGKVELFDIMNGEFLRIATDKLSNKRLAEIQFIQPQRIRNNLVQISLDQNTARGLVSIGPYIQYFIMGEGKRNEQKEDDRKKRNWKRLGKASYFDEVNFHLENYDTEVEQKKRDKVLLNKYNGSHTLTEQEELELVTTMSLETTLFATGDSEMDELEKALKLSLLEEESHAPMYDKIEEFAALELDEDDQLKMALQLSEQENVRQWKDEQYDENFEEKWETILN